MMGGDLSNESPASILVNLDVLVIPDVKVRKVLGLFRVPDVKQSIDLRMANALHRVASASSYSWEAFSIGLPEPSRLIDALDLQGLNPFRWLAEYDSPQDLMNRAVYRRNIAGIVDRPARALAYGGLYLDLGLIDGS